MPEELKSEPGLEAALISEGTFARELSMCKKLSRKREGKCNWGECAKCGVIPLLYKLGKGELYEKEEEVKKLKEMTFENEA